MDTYQRRYEAHPKRKAQILASIIKERHSTRQFSDQKVDQMIIDDLIESISECPSSCDRQGISLLNVDDRDKKALLGGILVGGVGWIHRASNILLIFADPIAYKAGDEIKFMPYLDGGVVIEHLYLKCSVIGLKCCFVNPNIREMNQEHFKKVFSDKIYCGAITLGYEK